MLSKSWLHLQRHHASGWGHAWHDALGHGRHRWFGWQIEVGYSCRVLHRSDQSLEVLSQRGRVAPRASLQNAPVRVDDELGVRHVAERVLQLVGHRVGDPRNAGPELPFRLRNVHQPFFQRERVDVVVELGVGELLVQVEELDAFWRVVAFDRLHPGDVGEKRRSSETAENEHRESTVQQRWQARLLAVTVVDRQVGHQLADGGRARSEVPDEPAATVRTSRLRVHIPGIGTGSERLYEVVLSRFGRLSERSAPHQ